MAEENEITKLKAELQQLKDEKVVLEERLKLLQEEYDKPVRCSRCGSPAANHPPQVDPETLKSYFRFVLAQKPFTFTYKLMDGSLILTFSSQYGSDIREIDSLLLGAIAGGKVMSDIKVEELMLVSELTTIQVYDSDAASLKTLYEASPEQKKEYAKNPEAGLDAITSKIDRITYQLVRRTFQKFALLCNALSQAAEDENFYKGVGLL